MTNEFGMQPVDSTPELLRPYKGQYVKIACNNSVVYGVLIESNSETTRLLPFLNDYSTPKLKEVRFETGIPLTLRTSAITLIGPTTRQYLEDLCIREEIKVEDKPK